jgi:branched-subunit amino acid transport protein
LATPHTIGGGLTVDDSLYVLVAIAGLTFVTVLTRASFFMLPASVELPVRVERALKYAPACALAAIVAPGVLTDGGSIIVGWGNHEMWAVLAAVAVGIRVRNMLVMIAVGMAVFTVLRFI